MGQFVDPRPFADPEAAARKLMGIANDIEPVQDGRIFIELINGSLFEHKGRAQPNMAPAQSSRLIAAGSGCTRAKLREAHPIRRRLFA
jgi:hypothetical protein